MIAGLGADRPASCARPRRPRPRTRATQAVDILARDDAQLDGEAAIGGGDVVGGAALDHADMQRGEGRVEAARQRRRASRPRFSAFIGR